ncbi:MAG: TolC family protein [Paludibacter sp.]|nr:TolC family protein [Paludibacter sp.]
MKRNFLLFCSIIIPFLVPAQSLTLDSCLSKALSRYPLVKQYGLIEKTTEYNLSNANRAWLPQFSLSAKASYQSDVTKIPDALGDILSKLSGRPVTFESLSRDQYQAVIDMQQTIWDGGMTAARKKAIKSSAEVEKQKLTVDLYSLNDRITQLYFGIMLIDGQLRQNKLLQDELAKNYKRVQAGIENGIAQSSDADRVKMEQMKAVQRETELEALNLSYRQMLGVFTGYEISSGTQLERPDFPAVIENAENNRPELLFFDAQQKALDAQDAGVKAAVLPKIGLFAQGGYANPALNMFDPGFNPFYIAGVRFNWNLSELYNKKDNLSKTDMGRKSVEVQKETFLFNNDLVGKQQRNEIERLKSVMKSDDIIIGLQKNIKDAAEVKYVNGTITVNDLLTEVTAESMAEQTRFLHEIQLYMAMYQYKYNTNN